MTILYLKTYKIHIFVFLYLIAYNILPLINNYIQKHIMTSLSEFVKQKRKQTGLDQAEFAERAGVALTVVRKIEQGKENLQLEKVNQVLKMFGHELAPVSSKEKAKDQKENL